ncbi:NPC intracellular cholesterol transporter 2 homolog a-like [Uranotaenia lowii]|uniref:NPC intracellular cholesterol transporter 2 homolog a-like n=1 Tax=Uranotaenia lowii TaxID=190385 RepID=UPI00247A003E|nr:NPC intracellular cholesterol transporter 2 homolog a-like [Uranotaenia lowii]XP_055610834.1 NPC intracellular cholesterol transporter 2 homolog a-like [Uranotaenia lowii]
MDLSGQLINTLFKATTVLFNRSVSIEIPITMKFVALVVAVLLPIAFADVIPVLKCGENVPEPVAVNIEGCSQIPCELGRGKDAVALVDFTVGSPVTALKPLVHAKALGVTVPFVLPEDRQDACQWLQGTRCPLSAQEDVRYELRLPVQQAYPAIAVEVELKLVDQDEQVVSCFKVQAKVV